MAKKKGGQTEQAPEGADSTSTEQTVDVTTVEGLADALRNMELEEVPKDEPPADAPAEAVEEAGDQPEENPTEPEQTEEEAEAEPTADDESAEGDDQSDELPRGVQKRIDKLTARAKSKDEELDARDSEIAQLKAKLEEAGKTVESPPSKVSDPTNPYRHLMSLEEVRREELTAESVLDWADDNPHGAVVAAKDGTESEYTEEDVREIRKKARKALSRQLPEQRKWIEEYKATDPYAEEAFPWWKDQTTSEYQAAVQVMKEFPEVMRFSGYKVSVGDLVEGMKLRVNKQQAATAKSKKRKAPPKAPEQPSAPVAEPAPIDESAARSASARQRFDKTRSVDDLAEILQAEL